MSPPGRTGYTCEGCLGPQPPNYTVGMGARRLGWVIAPCCPLCSCGAEPVAGCMCYVPEWLSQVVGSTSEPVTAGLLGGAVCASGSNWLAYRCRVEGGSGLGRSERASRILMPTGLDSAGGS